MPIEPTIVPRPTVASAELPNLDATIDAAVRATVEAAPVATGTAMPTVTREPIPTFTPTLSPTPTSTPLPVPMISLGETVSGDISVSGQVDVWTFSGSEGQRATIHMVSQDRFSDLVPTIEVLSPGGERLGQISGPSIANYSESVAQISELLLPVSGIYTVKSSSKDGMRGAYFLTVRDSSVEPIINLADVVSVRLASKKLLPIDFDLDRYSEEVEITLAFFNNGAKDIRSLTGLAHFADLFNRPLASISLTSIERIDADDWRFWTGTWKFNQFIFDENQVAITDIQYLQFSFETQAVIFADGSRLGSLSN